MENEQSEFWSKVAQKYDRVVDLQIGGKTRALIRDRLAREHDFGALVEFGCGTGFYTGVLCERANSVVATDLSPGMLAIARDSIKADNVRFQIEDCQATSFSDGAFDTAFMSLVIHFTNPAKTLGEMHRVVKPGGTLIITNVDPVALGAMDRLRFVLRLLYRGIVEYRVRPPRKFGQNFQTEEQLCALLDRNGFKVQTRETICDASRSSNVPVEYVAALRT